MSESFWTGFFLVVYLVVKEAFDWLRERRIAGRVANMENATKNVALTIGKIEEKVDEVHSATNGMKDALVKAAGKAGFADGVASEKAKADAP